MRWPILTLALLLCLPFSGDASRHRLLMSKGAPTGGGGGGGGCSTSGTDNQTGAVLDDKRISTDYTATWMTSTASETICKVELFLKNAGGGDPGWDGVIEIRAYTAGAPGAVVATSSETDLSGLTSSYAWIAFTGLSWSKSASTDYTITLKRSSGMLGGSVDWQTANIGDAGHDTLWTSTDGSSWTPIDIANLEQATFKTYK